MQLAFSIQVNLIYNEFIDDLYRQEQHWILEINPKQIHLNQLKKFRVSIYRYQNLLFNMHMFNHKNIENAKALKTMINKMQFNNKKELNKILINRKLHKRKQRMGVFI
ncbi:unnamed protein product [Paramecium sonneborni]|uniref:Uncharacterized protein n=1 Tax=Paramecium sonneborni TaxID=65129 RepID=A0A8S1KBU1_9CILI|nr:unnamed protein product [Paramecium sonneborni]